MAKYKQLCIRCKKNYVEMHWKQKPYCVKCELDYLDEPINDPKFRKLFNIDKKLYEQSYFLRSIKKNYLSYRKLSDAQIEAFKKTVKDLSK